MADVSGSLKRTKLGLKFIEVVMMHETKESLKRTKLGLK